jgi:hypothetical protein
MKLPTIDDSVVADITVASADRGSLAFKLPHSTVGVAARLLRAAKRDILLVSQ